MSLIFWINDDEGYEKWITNHPNGFIANITSTLTRSYYKIPRTSHNLPDRSNPNSTNPRTGNNFRKITADTLPELWGYAKSKGFDLGVNNFCKTCCQDLKPPIEIVPLYDLQKVEQRAKNLTKGGLFIRPKGNKKPNFSYTKTKQYSRDPTAKAWAIDRAKGVC